MRERLKGFLVICTSAVELIAEAWEKFFSAACTHAHGEVCTRVTVIHALLGAKDRGAGLQRKVGAAVIPLSLQLCLVRPQHNPSSVLYQTRGSLHE